MNKISLVISFAFLCAAPIPASHSSYLCAPDYNFSIHGNPPVLSFSMNNRFTLPFHGIHISEMDSRNRYVKTVWSIQRKYDQKSNPKTLQLQYGNKIAGWIETKPPLPLKTNTFYNINGRYYFKRLAKDKYLVLTAEQYVDGLK